MCGIIGYSGQKDADLSDLKLLLLMAQARGTDSTGLGTKEVTVKKAVDASEFVKKLELPSSKTVIGHTRRKTTGAITDRNAHPFQYGDLLGVHNGCITNFNSLKKEEETDDMQVDSEIIWHLINKYGLKEAITKMSGSFALGWLDQNEHLNLYRHTSPINIGFRDDNLFFGSTGSYLETIGCENVESLSEHVHYVISDGVIVEENDLTDVKPKIKTYSNTGYGGYNNRNVYPYQDGRTYDKDKDIDIRDSHNPTFAPKDAKHVVDPNGPVIYYWFDDKEKKKIEVEPIYLGVEYQWRETYYLNNSKQVKDMFEIFPALKNVDEIEELIAT